MGTVRRLMVAPLGAAVVLLLVLLLCSCGGVGATLLRTRPEAGSPPEPPPVVADAVRDDPPAVADGQPRSSRRHLLGYLSGILDTAPLSFTDADILQFRDIHFDLGVSMDQLMSAEEAGQLAGYETGINEGRANPLDLTVSLLTYRAIMAWLKHEGRCLDFIRQSTPDEPELCGVDRWRRCCRGTSNDADQVLLCATHENLKVYPAFDRSSAPVNSFRVRNLPLRKLVTTGTVFPILGRQVTPGGGRSTAGSWRERAATRGLAVAGTGGRGGRRATRTPPSGAATGSLATKMAALSQSAVRTASAGPSTAVKLDVVSVEAVPFYFEEQYEAESVPVDDAFMSWCKEFLNYGPGCVEYCCSSVAAGSSVCDVLSSPDLCP